MDITRSQSSEGPSQRLAPVVCQPKAVLATRRRSGHLTSRPSGGPANARGRPDNNAGACVARCSRAYHDSLRLSKKGTVAMFKISTRLLARSRRAGPERSMMMSPTSGCGRSNMDTLVERPTEIRTS
jgi:hypothetical protein